MQLIVRKEDGLVRRMLSDAANVALGENGAVGEVRSFVFTSETHELVSLPDSLFPVVGEDIYQLSEGQIVVSNVLAYSTRLKAKVQQELIGAVQARLDAFAQTRNYSGMLSLCTYATSTNAKFSAEGQYGVEARDATWATCYQILAEIEAGTRPVPAGYADIESELPALAWPE